LKIGKNTIKTFRYKKFPLILPSYSIFKEPKCFYIRKDININRKTLIYRKANIMESVKKTQERFLNAAKRETRGIIKATKRITTIPKHLIYFENYPPLKFKPVKYAEGLFIERRKKK
jgi:hypothetical protein